MHYFSTVLTSCLFLMMLAPVQGLSQDSALPIALTLDPNKAVSAELAKLVLEFGLRTSYYAEESITPEDISTERCGSSDRENVNIIIQSLNSDPNLSDFDGEFLRRGSSVKFPPCLPYIKHETFPRLVLPGDTVEAYYKADAKCDSCRPTEYPGSMVVINPSASWGEPYIGANQYNLESSDAFSESSDWSGWKYDSYAPDKSAEAFVVFNDALKGLNNYEPEEALAVAIDFASVDLRSDDEAKRYILSSLEAANSSFITNQSLIEAASELSRQATYQNGAPKAAVIPLSEHDQSLTRNIDLLNAGEIFIPVTEVVKNTIIPLDPEAIGGTTFEETKKAVEDILSSISDNSTKVSGPNVAHFFSVDAQCKSSGRNPDETSLRNAVAQALYHRSLKHPRKWKSETTEVLILDTGLTFTAPDNETDLNNIYPYRTRLIDEVERKSFGSDHGIAVTGLALGGPDYWPIASSLNILVKSENAYLSPPEAGRALLPAEFLKKNLQTPWHILNLSMGELGTSSHSMGPLSPVMGNRVHNRLVVIAAGNDGQSLSGLNYYPQKSLGEERTSYIVVGAADGNKRASFSNYSPDLVDIYAQGCGVESWDSNGELETYSGTSFAAPAVTFVAALLRSIEPNKLSDGGRLKARLLVSADNFLQLRMEGKDGRLLNPMKAISIYQDVIEIDGALQYGSFESARVQDFCENEINNVRVAKIGRNLTSVLGGGDDTVAYYTLQDNGTIDLGFCKPKEKVLFRREGGPNYEFMNMSDIDDAVMSIQ